MTVRELPTPSLKDYFAKNPNGSLRDLFRPGQGIKLYGASGPTSGRIVDVKDRTVSIYALNGQLNATHRFSLERTKDGTIIGMVSKGYPGYRAGF